MIRVAIIGVCGRMGSALAELILKETDLTVVGGVEAIGHPSVGTPIGNGFITTDLNSIISHCDVAIEFAIPEVTIDNARICARAKKPFITGTTGHKNLDEIKIYSKDIPILIAPNFSLGVNLLYKLVSDATKHLIDFDINIVEVHHKLKRDKPSGTAKRLSAIIKEVSGREVPIDSIRAGDIVGEHFVIFSGPGERLELIHRAASRYAFAYGAIKAIRFIVNQEPGLYQMTDVLKYYISGV
ncbi:MAG: 4-hydroxy-tetrahydrodipicolinate reductase [candidate division WOR-3 bacterium]|nr:4-hydroxy-tetrahydrodipicolinate reductase [candidate division WOR-3 bacterium]MCX7757622.1 4-hydroxy-tetrahydrodipicolinate reductase [candidate division WOR-3 bacterium]MDW7987606.1 4-hydroxy-tetrahydrodipicolinate reductase [candidate division WOR-3 bacterium]